MPTVESKSVEIEAEKRRETDRAIELYDGTATVWVPRSLLTDLGDGTWRLPEWLAYQKGLI